MIVPSLVNDIMLYLSMEILQKQDNVQCIVHDKAPKHLCQQRWRKSGALNAAGQKKALNPGGLRAEQRIAVIIS
ncbi:MAG: hypothetical protein D3922_05995 [Candidatus Electrothrix sp. AR1]|nr:hypothetical protein [Candidatus Electrothrix sp. AR1]